MDGTYVTDPHMILNRTGVASDIAVMTGTNRDGKSHPVMLPFMKTH